jgi:hypothetical protein
VTPERHDGGVPRATRKVSTSPGGASAEESWPGANQEKAEKLRVKGLKRRAGAQGLELRHSDYGYALFDTTRKLVNDRNNMSLSEIDSWLKRSLRQ